MKESGNNWNASALNLYQNRKDLLPRTGRLRPGRRYEDVFAGTEFEKEPCLQSFKRLKIDGEEKEELLDDYESTEITQIGECALTHGSTGQQIPASQENHCADLDQSHVQGQYQQINQYLR